MDLIGGALAVIGVAVATISLLPKPFDALRGGGPRSMPGFLVGVVIALIGAGILYVYTGKTTKAAERLNPPAMVTCREGVYICTLTLVVSERMMWGVQPDNSILLHDVRWTGGKAVTRVIFFVPDDPPLEPLVDATYTESDLELQDGTPVSPWRIHQVHIAREGHVGEVFKERIVFQ
jgi:hypothetical protein